MIRPVAIPHPAQRLDRMRWSGFLLLACLAAWPTGCVTAHDARAVVDIHNADGDGLDDVLLLRIQSQSPDSEGYWWVAQREPAAAMVPRSAQVERRDSGVFLHQPGHVIMLLGPYTKGPIEQWEYWVWKDGYCPSEFLGRHLELARDEQRPLRCILVGNQPGRKNSDEEVLDGARRLAEILDWLDLRNDTVGQLLALALRDVKAVAEASTDPDTRAEARRIAEALGDIPLAIPPAPLPQQVFEPSPTGDIDPVSSPADAPANP